jgi:hypothetical protein
MSTDRSLLAISNSRIMIFDSALNIAGYSYLAERLFTLKAPTALKPPKGMTFWRREAENHWHPREFPIRISVSRHDAMVLLTEQTRWYIRIETIGTQLPWRLTWYRPELHSWLWFNSYLSEFMHLNKIILSYLNLRQEAPIALLGFYEDDKKCSIFFNTFHLLLFSKTVQHASILSGTIS